MGEVFEPQIATNENVLDEREAMSLGGKTLIKTNKKNLPTGAALVNGEVIELDDGEFFDAVSLAPKSLPQFQQTIDSWFINMQRDQCAYPGMTGEEPKASTPAQSLQLQAAQGASIFNKRRNQVSNSASIRRMIGCSFGRSAVAVSHKTLSSMR
jgi:hypothetical protein